MPICEYVCLDCKNVERCWSTVYVETSSKS